MAIRRGDTSPAEWNLVVNNGDLEVLQQTASRLGFRDEESALRFMLAVLSKAATRAITITDQNGGKITLNPTADLLQPQPQTTV